MRYLGIRICRTNEEIVEKNIVPIIKKIQEKCRCWILHRGWVESQ